MVIATFDNGHKALCPLSRATLAYEYACLPTCAALCTWCTIVRREER